jgi:hypothetical protein
MMPTLMARPAVALYRRGDREYKVLPVRSHCHSVSPHGSYSQGQSRSGFRGASVSLMPRRNPHQG